MFLFVVSELLDGEVFGVTTHSSTGVIFPSFFMSTFSKLSPSPIFARLGSFFTHFVGFSLT